MKRTLTLLIACCLITLAACSGGTKPAGSRTMDPPSEASTSQPPETSASQPSEGTPPEMMSYEEFFSQTIDFVPRSNNPDLGMVFFYYEGGHDAQVDHEQFVKSIPNAVEGHLYKWQTNTTDPNHHVVEYSVLLEEEVSLVEWVGDDRIFCAVGDTLYSIGYSGEDKRVVLTADGPITNLKANETLVFYVANEYLYRHHLPDGITDKLCHAPGILPGFPMPLTNHQVYWCVYAPDKPEDDNRIWYIYTGPDGEPEEISFEEIERIYGEWNRRVS